MTAHTKQVKFNSIHACKRSHDFQYTAAALFFAVAFFAGWLSYERYRDKKDRVFVARWFLPLLVNVLGFLGAGFWVLGMYHAVECHDKVYVYK